MSRRILGLDIRYDGVAAVLVEASIKGNCIEDHIQVPVADPSDPIAGIASALETITGKIDISGAICNVSLPPDLISFRNIHVPFNEEKKIAQILPFELEPTLPFPVEDVILDFHAHQVSDQDSRTDLFVAGLENSTLNAYVDLLQSFNIRPKNITAGSNSPALCMARLTDPPEHYLFLDIGNQKTTVVGIASGKICMIRTFPSGSDGIATAGAICMGIHQSLAGLDDIPHLDYQPEVAFTTGTGITSEGLEQEIAQHLGHPVQRADLKIHGDLTFKQYPPAPWEPRQMDGALALALIETEGIQCLNFRKGPFAENKFWVEHKKSLIRTGVLATLVLVSALAFLFTDAHYTNKKINELDRQIIAAFTSTFPKVTVIVDPLQQMRVKLQEVKKKTLISTGPGGNVQAIDALNTISQRIPEDIDVQFTRLVIGDENIQITGDTDTLSAVDNMKSQLEKAELFKNVTITSANREKTSNRVRFKLKLQL